MPRNVGSVDINTKAVNAKTAQEKNNLDKARILQEISSSKLNLKEKDQIAKEISKRVSKKGNNFKKTKKISTRKFETHYDHHSCCGGLCGGSHYSK